METGLTGTMIPQARVGIYLIQNGMGWQGIDILNYRERHYTYFRFALSSDAGITYDGVGIDDDLIYYLIRPLFIQARH